MSAACRGADHGRLVGVQAPDFEAEAVYDQEFMNLSLSQYKCVIILLSLHPMLSYVEERAGYSSMKMGALC